LLQPSLILGWAIMGFIRFGLGLIFSGRRLLAALCLGSFAVASPAFAASDLSPIRVAMIEGMSGPFANAGAAVERNLRFGVERVNANGGVLLPDGKHPLQLVVLDGKGSSEASLVQLRAAIDQGIGFVMQGNSSAVAAASGIFASMPTPACA
jgi:branched-chain amino acid transport system substrate-binding protein